MTEQKVMMNEAEKKILKLEEDQASLRIAIEIGKSMVVDADRRINEIDAEVNDHTGIINTLETERENEAHRKDQADKAVIIYDLEYDRAGMEIYRLAEEVKIVIVDALE